MPKDLIPDVLPKALDDLARRINEAHTVALGSARTAIEHAIECGRLLTEAKGLVTHGEWLPWLAANTTISQRTAQDWIKYARNSDLLLTNTRSVAYLTFNEADKLIAAQNGDKRPNPTAQKPKRQPKAVIQKGLDAHDQIVAAGGNPTEEAIKEKAGVGIQAAGQAKAIRETEAKAAEATTVAAVEAATAQAVEAALSMSAQEKLSAAIRTHARKLDQAFEDRVRAECLKWREEHSIPAYLKKLDEVERMFTWPRNAVMTHAEYKTILMCLHPDGLKARTEQQLAEAFRIFTNYKPKLVPSEPDWKPRGDLPRTREEMLARKKKR